MNWEHADESFRSLQFIVSRYAHIKIRYCRFRENLTFHLSNWVKYLPRAQKRTTNRKYSSGGIRWIFPLSFTTLNFEKRTGVDPPPLLAKVAKYGIRARVKHPKTHYLLFMSYVNIIPIISVRAIFGHARTLDNFRTKIRLTSRTSDGFDIFS